MTSPRWLVPAGLKLDFKDLAYADIFPNHPGGIYLERPWRYYIDAEAQQASADENARYEG